MNVGRKGKKHEDDIPAYNGGLFYEDALLDALNINDELLITELRNLSKYDFNTEIDVNILGHIFEHSLNEIEEVSAEIQGTITDNSKSKRKKDGVFYTSKYISLACLPTPPCPNFNIFFDIIWLSPKSIVKFAFIWLCKYLILYYLVPKE